MSQLAWCALARAFKIHKSICTRNPKVVQNGYLKIGLYFAHLLSAAAYLLARHRPASLTQASLLHFAPLPHDSTAVAATALSAALEGATSITAAFISH